MKFLIVNGPNLNLQEFSDPNSGETFTFEQLNDSLEAACERMGIETDFYQSNHEGDLIDELQSVPGRADGVILNPGAYAYYSVAILEAVRACGVPVVEVLLESPGDSGEPFRRTDVVAYGCQGRFAGENVSNYLHAADHLARLLRLGGAPHPHLAM